MFVNNLPAEARQRLLKSLRGFVRVNSEKEGWQLFQAEILWLEGNARDAETLLEEFVRESADAESKGLGLLTIRRLHEVERNHAAGAAVREWLRRLTAQFADDKKLQKLMQDIDVD